MIYKVNENYEGAVVIGDREFHATQIIKDDGTNPKLTKSIERLLKLEESPITLVEESKPEGFPENSKASPELEEKGGEKDTSSEETSDARAVRSAKPSASSSSKLKGGEDASV